MKAALIIFLMLAAGQAYPQECSGEQVVSSLICTSVQLPDVRLYISEYQTCENGKITDLTKSILGMTVNGNDIHTFDAEQVVIKFADKRTMIDPEVRSDFLSFLLPDVVRMQDGNRFVEMAVTDVTEPDYEGSDSTHFKGTFKTLGHQGDLFCFVYR